MQQAFARQMVAEWRDRQIVAGGALINLRGAEARSALEQELEAVTAKDAVFSPVRLARNRIDALMRTALTQDLAAFFGEAAEELRAVDDRLGALGDALAATAIAMPTSDAEPEGREEEDGAESPVVPSQPTEEDAAGRERWLGGLAGRLHKGVATISQSAGAAADTLLNERLGLINRVRTAAAIRLEQAWMNEVDQPDAVLHQLIMAIDSTAREARIQLS